MYLVSLMLIASVAFYSLLVMMITDEDGEIGCVHNVDHDDSIMVLRVAVSAICCCYLAFLVRFFNRSSELDFWFRYIY